MNSSATTIAKRYSTALFESVKSNEEMKSIRNQSESLLMILKPEIESVFSKAAIEKSFKKSLLEELLSVLKVENLLAKTLRLLFENNRASVLRPFLVHLLNSIDEVLGIKRVEYICASEPSASELKDIEKELAAALKKSVQLSVTLKPDILAGCIVKIGHQVVDMSLTTRITNIREALSQGV